MRAIEHDRGPACVIAGPGSGKTFVIIKRVVRLIEKGISPSHILIITFTKQAAIEMQQRFIKETNSMYPEVLFGTFHSVFYQILKVSSPKKAEPVTLISEKQKYIFMSEILSELRQMILAKSKGAGTLNNPLYDSSSFEYNKDTIKTLISEISRLKNEGNTDPEDKSFEYDKSIQLGEYFPYIFREYDNLLKQLNLIDFDDMVLMCYKLLRENKEILEAWQEKFKYILIDEYQDINNMQFKVVRLLSKKHENLFVVGDDDQSIYGFRGSSPKFMLMFDKYYKNAEKIILDVNYRCAPEILKVSLKVINENNNRFRKNIKAGSLGIKGQCKLLSFSEKSMQSDAIIKQIRGITGGDNPLFDHKDIAVIFRTNIEASAMALIFTENKIPFFYKEKIVSPYDKPYIKDLVSYLDFACGGFKRGDFLKIMNKPLRYITRDCLMSETVSENEILMYYKRQGKLRMMDRIQRFFRDIKMVQKLKPYLAINFVRKVMGYDNYIKEKYGKDRTSLKEITEEINNFEETVKSFTTYKQLKAFLEDIASDYEKIKGSNLDKSGVRIMTMHASKGLEFKVVFLPDLNEGIIPSRKSISDESIEEERRMLYVAMTRAKEKLYLSYINGGKSNPMRMSHFLTPIVDDIIKNR